MSAALPRFAHRGFALRKGTLRYDPRGDLIFPSVVPTEGCVANPLGRFYLYYAPHDAPGGLCLAHSDDLSGPWTEHPANPLIGRVWVGHYEVSHVSSPHALWMPGAGRLFLYFHGENNTTRVASSRDGIHFEYERVAVDTTMYEEISEASYARVFPCAVPGRDTTHVLLFMGNNAGTRRVYAAWSKDGLHFESQRRPLVSPPPGTAVSQVGGPWLFPFQGRNLVVFHGDIQQAAPSLVGITSDLYVADVGPGFDREDHLGVFYPRTQAGADTARVSDPCIVEEAGIRYLFSAVGPRLGQEIAWAIEETPVA